MEKLTKSVSRTFSVSVLPLCIVGLVLAAAPACAQGVFDMGVLTNTLSQGVLIESEKARAKKNSPSRKRSSTSRRTLGTFRVSSVARKRNIDSFIAKIRRVDPRNAALLEKSYRTNDIFGAIDRAVGPYGMRTNNVADAFTLYLTSAWQGSDGRRQAPTKAQILGLREQLARSLGNTSIASLSDVKKQELADTMLLSGVTIESYIALGKRQPSSLPQIRNSIAQGVQSGFGLNMNKLKLTNQGLQ